jgi:hypothetical protein
MESSTNKVDFIARAVIYNLLTVDIALPFQIGIFKFNKYPDEAALQYHLGQGEQSSDWDIRYPKWHIYIEFPFSVNKDTRIPESFQTKPPATKLFSKLLTILQLYSTTPVGGHIHSIRPVASTDFTDKDVILFPKEIGGNPSEPEVYFIAQDNIDAIRQHIESLWNEQWHPIHLAVSRYMHSYNRDIFAEGFEPDDAFMDLMIALENLFGSHEAVVFKIAMRAACFLETTAEDRRKLNKSIKDWYKKRSKIAHGNGDRVVDWRDVEELREIVRRAIMAIWRVRCKGDDFDDYLFLGEKYHHTSDSR